MCPGEDVEGVQRAEGVEGLEAGVDEDADADGVSYSRRIWSALSAGERVRTGHSVTLRAVMDGNTGRPL